MLDDVARHVVVAAGPVVVLRGRGFRRGDIARNLSSGEPIRVRWALGPLLFATRRCDGARGAGMAHGSRLLVVQR